MSSRTANSFAPNDELENVSKSRAGLLFQELLNGRRELLNSLCNQASLDVAKVHNMPESISDAIRSAIGKSNLLIRKKFAKFQQLITSNLNDYSTDELVSVDDLVGFWSLIKLELQDIQALFDKIAGFRASGWVLPPEEVKPKRSPTTRVVTKPRAVPTTIPKTEAQKQREQSRQEMMKAAKEKMKMRLAQDSANKDL